jgi:hypothetical protein
METGQQRKKTAIDVHSDSETVISSAEHLYAEGSEFETLA